MANEHQLWARLGAGMVKSPDDDNLRLGFAEELEADDDIELKSQERAQFIYAQLALSSINFGHSEWMRLATEIESLLLDNKERWIPGWYRTAGIRDPEFHRGFIECVTVSAEMLLETGERRRPISSRELSRCSCASPGTSHKT